MRYDRKKESSKVLIKKTMKAYPVEFRKKIIEVYQEEKISQAKLAMRFRVALSFVDKIIKQWRETGDVSPKPHGG